MYVVVVPLLLSWLTHRLFVRNRDYRKPRVAFQPPGYVFGIVWTLLYLLFGLYLHLLSTETKGGGHVLVALWTINLALNLLWSPLVFVHERYVHGLYVSFGILFTLMAMTVLTESTQLKLLLLPYLTWMILAILLNVELVNNRHH